MAYEVDYDSPDYEAGFRDGHDLRKTVSAELQKSLTTAQAEIEARDALLRECLRWLPLLENHEAGSTTDLLCDRIRATLGEQP